MTLRVSEVYLSVQGEGPQVGQRTVFVRFGGCNLRCPGWPCDTPYAIDPKLYRNEWEKYQPEMLAQQIAMVADNNRDTSICFTGGEPFLQKSSELELLLGELWDVGYRNFECFSNGTIWYPEWATAHISFIMDWKLPGSGEDPYNETRLINLEHLRSKDAIKFVIKDADDYRLAKTLYRRYIEDLGNAMTKPRVYYGVVWGALDNSELISWVLEDGLPWYLNLQTHNYVFDRTQRGI